MEWIFGHLAKPNQSELGAGIRDKSKLGIALVKIAEKIPG